MEGALGARAELTETGSFDMPAVVGLAVEIDRWESLDRKPFAHRGEEAGELAGHQSSMSGADTIGHLDSESPRVEGCRRRVGLGRVVEERASRDARER